MHVHKHNPTEKAESDLVAEIANVVQKKDLAREITNHDERDNAILVRDRIQKFHRLESTLRPQRTDISLYNSLSMVREAGKKNIKEVG